MTRDPDRPPTLGYAGRPGGQRPLDWFRKWFSYRGSDSFLGCSALFFAVLPWAIGVIDLAFAAAGGPAGLSCFGLPMAALGVILGLAGLVEREVSRTFPAAAIVMGSIYLLVMFVVATLR